MALLLKRSVAILALLIVALSAASCAASAPAAPVPYALSTPGAAMQPFSLDVGTAAPLQQNCMRYLQWLLQKKGWDVTFLSHGSNEQLPETWPEQEFASGAAADGYILEVSQADDLLAQGLAQDLKATLPSVAPALYSMCGTMFPEKMPGIPCAFLYETQPAPACLMLRQDIAGKLSAQIDSVDDVFSLLKNGGVSCKIAMETYDYDFLLDAWAEEQGYYPLDMSGRMGYLFASLDDAKCKPVPVENIPGFERFATNCTDLLETGQIIDPESSGDTTDAIGTFHSLSDLSNSRYLFNCYLSGMSFVAYPLAPALMPLPENADLCTSVVAVPAGGSKAAAIAQFMQWALMDQDNYDLVRYGVKGVDYCVDGGRLQPLIQGRVPEALDWKSGSMLFFRDNYGFCGNTSRELVNVYYPVNYDQVAAKTQSVVPPKWRMKSIGWDSQKWREAFSGVSKSFEDSIDARRELVDGLFGNSSEDGSSQGGDVKAVLGKLADM